MDLYITMVLFLQIGVMLYSADEGSALHSKVCLDRDLTHLLFLIIELNTVVLMSLVCIFSLFLHIPISSNCQDCIGFWVVLIGNLRI